MPPLPSHMGDFFHSSMDHIRALYYLTEFHKENIIVIGGNTDAPLYRFNLNLKRFLLLFKKAVKLQKEGFEIPVRYPDNVEHNTKICIEFMSHTQEIYLEFLLEGYSFCSRFLCKPNFYFEKWGVSQTDPIRRIIQRRTVPC